MAKVGESAPNSDQSENDEQEEMIETQNKRKSLQPELEEDEVKYNIKFTVPMRKKLRNDYDPEEEARLERLVFGDHADVLNNLLQDDDDNGDSESKLHSTAHLLPDTTTSETDTLHTYHISNENGDEVSTDKSDPEDEVEGTESDSGVEEEDIKNGRQPAWIDDDDAENCSVQKALHLQHRKLPVPAAENTYKELLINKYQQLVGTPKWAELDRKKDFGSEEESDDEVLRHSSHLITPKVKNLAPGTIELKALKNINHETRTEGPVVTNLQFHPTSTVALVAGLSGVLSIFQIDGRTNTKLHSMQYHRFPINTARFTKKGSEIVVGSGRHAYCHAYDLLAGKTHRIPLPHGMTNMKKFELSPDEKFIAVCGRMGVVYVLSSKTKELVSTMKMNDQCTALAFSPDSTKLFTHGEGGEMYVWDLRERTCMHRAVDDGCLAGSTITVSPSGQYLATGSKQGVVNVYDMGTVLEKRSPTPIKIVLNLVTSITSLRFNPSSEILSMASDDADNAFKMMHFPSATIFSNFPSFNTRLKNPIAVDFSPSSGYLGITNNKGSAYLYRLKHYGNY